MKFRAISLSLAAWTLAVCATGAAAQTVVNINGAGSTGAGANIFAYPVAPGSVVSLFNPVLLDMAAGDYQLKDAWGLAGALYDTWNFEQSAPGSWASHFVAAEVLGGGQYKVLVDGVSLLDPTCKNHFCAWDTQAQASAAFLATPAFSMHLDHAMTVAFVSADYYLPDNLGGISLLVTAVPEPASFGLLMLGLLGLSARRLQSKRPA